MDNNFTIQIQMLGDFCLTVNGSSISSKAQQAKKPWNILEYLAYYHEKNVSSEELIRVIWPDGKDVNSANALKTLIFRTRKILEIFQLPTSQILIQNRGAYCWSPEVTLIVDAHQFEQLCQLSQQPGITEREKLSLLTQALKLYQGDFLPKSAWEPWVIPISSHYHELFVQSALNAIDLLAKDEKWEAIVALCRHAVQIEAYNEEFHYYLIYALYQCNLQNEALEQYRNMTDSFYNEFAITPSARITDLYKMIQNKSRGIVTDLAQIQESMQETKINPGAYLCEFPVFKDLYQLEQRAIARTGESLFLCLLTLTGEDGFLPKSSILNRAMEHLNHAVVSSLRYGDVYTRYSISQYMILLPSASYENSEIVMQRIIRKFKKLYMRKELMIHYSLRAVTPLENAGYFSSSGQSPH